MSRGLPILLVLAVSSSIAACDSQVDAVYAGTPLVRLAVKVQNNRTRSAEDTEIAILWNNASRHPQLAAGGTVQVNLDPSATFQLLVYDQPEDALINEFSGSRFGVAYIFSGKAGTDYASDSSPALYGFDPDHLLVYLPADVTAGSYLATLLRGTPRAGFHIYNVGHLTEASSQARGACEEQLPAGSTLQELYDRCGGSPVFDDFLPSPGDLDTTLEVDLVDDPKQLDAPNWF